MVGLRGLLLIVYYAVMLWSVRFIKLVMARWLTCAAYEMSPDFWL